MPKEVLKAEKLNKYFHEPATFQVLHDIYLVIHEGEFISIMGKSGCGNQPYYICCLRSTPNMKAPSISMEKE